MRTVLGQSEKYSNSSKAEGRVLWSLDLDSDVLK